MLLRVIKTSNISPSMFRWVGGGPDEEAPDLRSVSRAASPKARTWKIAMSAKNME
jgi:hypothetical protein